MDSENKQNKIINMFNDIAPTYDAINHLTSIGIDVSWRKEACKEAFNILNKSRLDIADIACGTGDMMMHWQLESEANDIKINSLVGVDPSSGMLSIAKEKINNGIFYLSKADELPLDSNSKDILSIAYGLRNIINRSGSLREFYRVLKPGGVLVILEFTSHSKKNILSHLMRLYTKTVLPMVGGIISRNFRAYTYLPKSIDEFITRESLEAELSLNGLQPLFSKNNANISSLIIARK